MSQFVILLNGPVRITERLKRQVRLRRTIAADGGIIHAAPLGLNTELWAGDFDSTSEELARRYASVPQLRFPEDKDKTDGDLAAEAAIKRGATSLVFVGGLGGQSDHAFAHLTLTVRLAQTGIPAFITNGDEEAYPVVPGTQSPDLPRGSRLSLLPITDLDGLSLTGTKWPLLDVRAGLGSTRTLSNIVSGPLSIELRSGYGIVIAYPASLS